LDRNERIAAAQLPRVGVERVLPKDELHTILFDARSIENQGYVAQKESSPQSISPPLSLCLARFGQIAGIGDFVI